MMAGFHSMMPVTGCLTAEVISLRFRHQRVFPDWTLPLVALFGVLPDICSPHISLEDRHGSFSHTLLFLAVLVPVCGMIVLWFEKGMRLRVAVVMWLAAMLHLAADAVSGGIAWLAPWNEEPIGEYYLEPFTWPIYDAVFILAAWLLWRWRQRLELRAYERELRGVE
ncbi:metal-dependent hydrolase [Luteolibacter sp. LG18]|uniref:metal-dependent hydrolase n=1 Tax=Luteolibacter sp. LG18 TaxID=2819286 RepID=UPI0030C77D46